MKKIVKGVLIGLLIIFVLIQFIRPAKNTGKAEATTDIIHAVQVPDTINKIFQVSCYDCHSNNTHYPWYAEVSPMSLLLASHVKGGKKDLNFTEFASLSPRRMRSKLSAIAEQVEKEQMPLKSYLLIHTNARLKEGQIKLIKDWTDSAKQEISLKNK